MGLDELLGGGPYGDPFVVRGFDDADAAHQERKEKGQLESEVDAEVSIVRHGLADYLLQR